MTGTRQTIQYSLALELGDQGETPVRGHQGTEPSVAKPALESPALTEQLMEEVCNRENLVRAWKRVRQNKGSPGVDGMTIDDAKDYLREHWPSIRSQLLEGTYRPQPVKRVEIPKPDGGVRKLGVPCVVDRLIQQALLQVLQKRWDPTWSTHLRTSDPQWKGCADNGRSWNERNRLGPADVAASIPEPGSLAILGTGIAAFL